MRRTHNSISWLEILIVNLAALLAIGAMGSSRQQTGNASEAQQILLAHR
jgi:hypothetical protein